MDTEDWERTLLLCPIHAHNGVALGVLLSPWPSCSQVTSDLERELQMCQPWAMSPGLPWESPPAELFMLSTPTILKLCCHEKEQLGLASPHSSRV